jgi:hypothetical protein
LAYFSHQGLQAETSQTFKWLKTRDRNNGPRRKNGTGRKT